MPLTAPSARPQEPRRSYDRTWKEMEDMLEEAERVQQADPLELVRGATGGRGGGWPRVQGRVLLPTSVV